MSGRGERTRRRLLDAAAEVFATRGFHSARVDDIVKVAKTSHGTFYLYFENKEDLFGALAAEVTAAMLIVAQSFPDFGPDRAGVEALEHWLGEFATAYDVCGPILRAGMTSDDLDDDAGRLNLATSANLVTAIEERLRTSSHLPDDFDTEVGAIAIVAMIERSHFYLAAGHAPIEVERFRRSLARITHAAVYGSAVS